MDQRVERDLIRPCEFLLDSQRRVAVGLLVPGLICAGISAAATFLNGGRAARGQDKQVFVNFVSRYMHPDLSRALQQPPDPHTLNHADWLYRYVRCGLAHAFALEWGHIEGQEKLQTIVGQSQRGQPEINQNALVDDFAQAWKRYLAEVTANPTSAQGQSFERRFNEVFHD